MGTQRSEPNPYVGLLIVAVVVGLTVVAFLGTPTREVPGFLPIMWAYYRLFDPAVLANLRPGHGAVDLWASRVQDGTPVGVDRAGGKECRAPA